MAHQKEETSIPQSGLEFSVSDFLTTFKNVVSAAFMYDVSLVEDRYKRRERALHIVDMGGFVHSPEDKSITYGCYRAVYAKGEGEGEKETDGDPKGAVSCLVLSALFKRPYGGQFLHLSVTCNPDIPPPVITVQDVAIAVAMDVIMDAYTCYRLEDESITGAYSLEDKYSPAKYDYVDVSGFSQNHRIILEKLHVKFRCKFTGYEPVKDSANYLWKISDDCYNDWYGRSKSYRFYTDQLCSMRRCEGIPSGNPLQVNPVTVIRLTSS